MERAWTKNHYGLGPEKVCKFDPSDDIAVHVAMDNTLDESEKNTIGILLFISLCLGLSEINPAYIPGLGRTPASLYPPPWECYRKLP
jgi:hypothetical protein